MDKFELVRFTDEDFELDVRADSEKETVWLTQKRYEFIVRSKYRQYWLAYQKHFK